MILLIAAFGKYAVVTKMFSHNKPVISGKLEKGDGTDIDKNILIDDTGEKVILFQPDGVEDKVVTTPTPKPVVPKPYISAESYLVANIKTGEKYIEFNTDKVFPIASVSKLYTALVVRHLFDQEKKITITQTMLDEYGDAGNLVLGEQLTPDELLHALLLESSNDAALGFAEAYGYNEFITEMNGFAGEIGMSNTYFKDPSGLSSSNVSSVSDLFILSKYLYSSEVGILEISRKKIADFASTTERGPHHFVNINPFSNYPEFFGGKTGRTTQAKEAMVSIFNQKVDDVEYPIVVIVLRSDLGEREINTEKLLGLFIDKISKK